MQSRLIGDYANFSEFASASSAYGKAHFRIGDRVRAVIPPEESDVVNVLDGAVGVVEQSLYAAPGDVVDGDGDIAVKFETNTKSLGAALDHIDDGVRHIPALWLDRETQ